MSIFFRDNDMIERLLNDLKETQDSQIESLRYQNKFLLEQMLQMKREGFQYTEPFTAPDRADDIPDEVLDAILQRAPEGTGLFTDLVDYARSELLRDHPPEKLATKILRGGDWEEQD